MKKPKLSAEQLSRVLTLADSGELDYFADNDGDSWQDEGRACVAAAAFCGGPENICDDRWWNVSGSVSQLPRNCGGDPDTVLRNLEQCGLA